MSILDYLSFHQLFWKRIPTLHLTNKEIENSISVVLYMIKDAYMINKHSFAMNFCSVKQNAEQLFSFCLESICGGPSIWGYCSYNFPMPAAPPGAQRDPIPWLLGAQQLHFVWVVILYNISCVVDDGVVVICICSIRVRQQLGIHCIFSFLKCVINQSSMQRSQPCVVYRAAGRLVVLLCVEAATGQPLLYMNHRHLFVSRVYGCIIVLVYGPSVKTTSCLVTKRSSPAFFVVLNL
jgi:hypothetical protein